MASKNRKWWILVLIVAIAALVVAAIMKAKAKPKGTQVQFEKVEKRRILEKVSASGKIFPETEVKISSYISGEIVDLFVEEGDSVMIGQILAKIDPESYLSSVARGRASVNNSRANQSTSEAQIRSSIAQKEQIEAQLSNAIKIHDRNKKLKAEGVISEAEYEVSLSNMEALQANLKASEASIESAKKSSEAAKFMVQSADASLSELKTSLNRTTIRAPYSGVISSLSVEVGETVVGTIQFQGTEMMRIADLNSLEVQVDVSENDVLRVSLGDSVDIEVDAYLDRIFRGTITEIANSASNIASAQVNLNSDEVTNFIVKINIDPASYQDIADKGIQFPFRPGMSATVDIYTESVTDKLTVPIQSVTARDLDEDDKEEKFEEIVFVYDADTVKVARVITGIQDDEFIVISEGLAEDQVVISGPYAAISKTLKSGSVVREKKEEKEKKKD